MTGGLFDTLARRIRRTGPITVADYMAACLGDPDHGYYTGRDPFGTGGDFITAPEITQMFGELLGAWCVERWSSALGGGPVHVVELGPGRGTLAADMVRLFRTVPGFTEQARLHLVETSPVLRGYQERMLASVEVTWHDSIDTLPDDAPLVVVANEFFDALPARQFIRTEDGWDERLIGLNAEGTGLAFTTRPMPDPALPEFPIQAARATPGQVLTVSNPVRTIVQDLTERLTRRPGALLAIDYGPAAPGLGDTLQAVCGHAFADVLERPGEQDLTVHVDFPDLAETARKAGGAVHGPVTQRAFLVGLGLLQRARALADRATPDEQERMKSAVARLIQPDAMGTLFKVMAITSPDQTAPAGFEGHGKP